MNALVAALVVTVQPAFGLECRPEWNAGAAVIEAANDGEARRVSVDLVDYQSRRASIELDLPARSHKRVVVMPPLAGRVTVSLVDESGIRTALPYPFRQECEGPAVAAFLRQDGRGVAVPVASGGVSLAVGSLTREDLVEWRPLMALDGLVAEARALAELSDGEREVVRRWVLSGGVLVVTPGVDPNPLFRSGWLPADLETAQPWSSRPWGAGAVAVTNDMNDPRIGGLVLVTSSSRDAWMRATAPLFEAQRDAAGPSGRASRPAGVLTLGAFFLLAAIGHELLRRRYVTGARDFDRYFRGAALVLGVTALSGVGAALTNLGGAGNPELVLAHGSGWGVRSRAIVLAPGRARSIAPDVWPFIDPQIRLVLGARNAVENAPGSTRVATERRAFVHEGIRFDGASLLTNRTSIDFDAGALVTPAACYSIGPLASGNAATAQGTCLESPELQEIHSIALALSTPVYSARADGVRYVITLEKP